MEKDENPKKKNKQRNGKEEKKVPPLLTHRTKRWIKATLMFLVAIIISLSFLNKSGRGGQLFFEVTKFLIGIQTHKIWRS